MYKIYLNKNYLDLFYKYRYMKVYGSMTTIYSRQDYLLNTLISLKNQTYKVDKYYIWLSEEPHLKDKGFTNRIINNDILTFINNNNDQFEIRWTPNIGPYRKLLPLLKEKWNEDCLILTFDDDIIYNKNLIENIIQDYNKHKCCIAYRGFTPRINDLRFINFNYISDSTNIIPKSLINFANSGVGTLTHPTFFHKTGNLIFDMNMITKLANTTDDIWYYFCRIANNIETFLEYKPYYFNFKHMQKDCLFRINSAKENEKFDKNSITFQNVAKEFIENKFITKINTQF